MILQFLAISQDTGKDNVNSDCLSRSPLPEVEPYGLVFTLNSINEMPITCADIKKQTDLDKDLLQLKRFSYTCG